MFNKVMTGGACSGGEQGQLQQNAFTNMMDQMIMGDAKAKQGSQAYQNAQQMQNQQQMDMLNAEFQMMKQQEMMERQFESMQINTMSQPQSVFQNQSQDLNAIWDQMSGQNPQQMMQQQPQQHSMGAAPWMMAGGLSQMPRMYQPAPQLIEQTAKIQEEIKEEQKQKANISDVTKNMVDVLSTSSNPKHRNSKFLKFLNKLNYGAYELDGDKLIKHQDKIKEFREIDTQRRELELKREVESKQMPQTAMPEDLFTNILEGNQDLTEEGYDQMMKEWMGDANQAQQMEQMMQEWTKQWDMQMNMQQLPVDQPTLQFQLNNPYMQQTSESKLDTRSNLEIAKELVSKQQIQEAIMCLEAEVQQNTGNNEAWRMLGQLYQENDQDDNAILAFKNAHEADPYDLDSLMLLGVSCTNELVERDAKNYLHDWLKLHPDYSNLPGVMQFENPDFLQLKEIFDQAHMKAPKDGQVLMALGILNFIGRNYVEASECFVLGIQQNPTDHSMWNKFGACMSNNMDLPQAVAAYEQALELRPNYVRTIVNLGLAQNRMNDNHKAAQQFLNALVLNPQVTHVWGYLRQSFMKMSRFDLIEKMEERDPNIFRNEFNLIDPKNMPQASMDGLATQEILN